MFIIPLIRRIFENSLTVSILITAVICLTTCKKEESTTRTYPRLKNTEVKNITDSGVVFSAELYSLGNEPVIEHGFVWAISGPNINTCDKVLFGPTEKLGTFNANITSSLRKGLAYNVKSFVLTSNIIVYGPEVSFRSLGSNAPSITGFLPHSARWADTLSITGKHFSWVTNTNIIRLGGIMCPAISSTDSTLKVVVSSDLKAKKSIMSVELQGNMSKYTKDTFNLIISTTKDLTSKSNSSGDKFAL